MKDQIERIEQKLTAQSVSVDRVISEEAVRAFEARYPPDVLVGPFLNCATVPFRFQLSSGAATA